MEDQVVGQPPVNKKKDITKAGVQAEALGEMPSPEPEASPSPEGKFEKAANQGGSTSGATVGKGLVKEGNKITSGTASKPGPIPTPTPPDLAAAARAAKEKLKGPPTITELSDAEVDALAAQGNLGAVAEKRRRKK